jgi:hypothetical protein
MSLFEAEVGFLASFPRLTCWDYLCPSARSSGQFNVTYLISTNYVLSMSSFKPTCYEISHVHPAPGYFARSCDLLHLS